MKNTASALSAVILVLAGCASAPTEQQEAFAATRARAETGDVVAERQLGEMYLYGQGTAMDQPKAIDWFTKAAAGGDAQAQYHMAFVYQQGIRVPKDLERGHALLLQSADQGYVPAEYSVGFDQLYGLGTPADYAGALEWFQRAAEGGDANAARALGGMYRQGVGTQRDDILSMRWYQRAADLGDHQSQLIVASAYYLGDGVPKDEAKGERYYLMAANPVVASTADLASSMKEMIDLHKVYPKEAVAAKQAGDVVVEFDCPDRTPENIKVTQSSGVPSLDAAAVQAVQESVFPDRAPQLKSLQHFKVAIDFSLDAPAPGAYTPAPAGATH